MYGTLFCTLFAQVRNKMFGWWMSPVSALPELCLVLSQQHGCHKKMDQMSSSRTSSKHIPGQENKKDKKTRWSFLKWKRLINLVLITQNYLYVVYLFWRESGSSGNIGLNLVATKCAMCTVCVGFNSYWHLADNQTQDLVAMNGQESRSWYENMMFFFTVLEASEIDFVIRLVWRKCQDYKFRSVHLTKIGIFKVLSRTAL